MRGEGLHTYQEVVDAVGEDNIIFAEYEQVPKDEVAALAGTASTTSPVE